MKISIIGFSGSGKSTLAKLLSLKYNINLLYLDHIQWDTDWKARDEERQKELVNKFISLNDSWVIDGNYIKLYQEERLEQSDLIIELLFNRFSCLRRVIKRHKESKINRRESLPIGCDDKIDFEFVMWVLFKGRTIKSKKHYKKNIGKIQR